MVVVIWAAPHVNSLLLWWEQAAGGVVCQVHHPSITCSCLVLLSSLACHNPPPHQASVKGIAAKQDFSRRGGYLLFNLRFLLLSLCLLKGTPAQIITMGSLWSMETNKSQFISHIGVTPILPNLQKHLSFSLMSPRDSKTYTLQFSEACC